MAVMKEEGWKHGETDERPRSGCESQPLQRAMDGKKKQYSRLRVTSLEQLSLAEFSGE